MTGGNRVCPWNVTTSTTPKKEGKGDMSSDNDKNLKTSTMVEETGNRIIKERTGLWPLGQSVGWSAGGGEAGQSQRRSKGCSCKGQSFPALDRGPPGRRRTPTTSKQVSRQSNLSTLPRAVSVCTRWRRLKDRQRKRAGS